MAHHWILVVLAAVGGALACNGAGSTSGSMPSTSGGASGSSGAPDGSSGGMSSGTPSSSGSTPGADAGDAGASGPLVAFVSGYGPKLATFSVAPATGALTPASAIDAFGAAPSFLATNRTATNLYAVDESSPGRVGAYAIDKVTGALTYVNDVGSAGDGPAHVSVDASGKWVFVANYLSGTVAVLPALAGGALGAATDTKNAGANAHMIIADPSNQWVFVPCLGSDWVAQYRFDQVAGTLTANPVARVMTASGAGPRHLAFHPNGKRAYLLNEKASTLTALSLDLATGRLAPIETKSTLPSGFSGTNNTAEVWVHPSGKWVYASNRGDDSIATFSLDAATGAMTLVGHTKTGGATPRDFTLDPTGTFLYAANQGSGSVVPFRIDATGKPSPTASAVTATQPSFIGVVRLPPP
jgi:6-phosphogluconolactonase